MSAKFKLDDYQKAFDLKGEGTVVDSVPDLVDYVTGLLQWIKSENPKNKKKNPLNLDKPDLAKRLTSAPYSWWFRGVWSDNAEHHLMKSSVFRCKTDECGYQDANTDPHTHLERRLRHEYTTETRRRFDELSCNVWDRLFEMQHYGMPTRLLDWTRSLMNAIFFALDSPRKHSDNAKQQDCNPTIWILNPRILSGVFLGEYALNDYAYLEIHGTIDEIKQWKIKWGPHNRDQKFGTHNWIYHKLIAKEGHFPVLASWTNQRLLSQLGCFTIQGGKSGKSLDELAQVKGQPHYLLKVRLNNDKKNLELLREQLRIIGVERRFLFPEKENISTSIVEQRKLWPPK